MSRGKHQASQNAKKLAAAQERIVELEKELAAVKADAHSTEQNLASEIQSLKNRMTSEAAQMAEARVKRAAADAGARVAEVEKMRRDSAIEVVRYLNENLGAELPLTGWRDVAAILKVPVGELITSASSGNNRTARRANRAHLNAVAELKKSAGKGTIV